MTFQSTSGPGFAFSVYWILENELVTIPFRRQMVVANEFILDGELVLNGDIAFV